MSDGVLDQDGFDQSFDGFHGAKPTRPSQDRAAARRETDPTTDPGYRPASWSVYTGKRDPPQLEMPLSSLIFGMLEAGQILQQVGQSVEILKRVAAPLPSRPAERLERKKMKQATRIAKISRWPHSRWAAHRKTTSISMRTITSFGATPRSAWYPSPQACHQDLRLRTGQSRAGPQPRSRLSH